MPARFLADERQEKAPKPRLLHFNLTTGAISILGNLLLMRMLVGQAHLPLLPANLISIAGCSLLNFLVSDSLVFRRSERAS